MTYFVCRPEVAADLKKEFPTDDLTDLPGIQIHIKQDQIQPVWAFSKLEVMRKYLNNELAEADLVSFAKLN